jgi:multidrug efflux pump subunit AcrA (membrane-fusion protein)
MAATDDIITALDTPVDLVPMGETQEEKAAGLAKVKPRSMRIVLNLLWYVGLVIFLIGFLGSLVWNKVEGITLSHARVYAERTELRAPGEGYLQIETGILDTVIEGAPLARLFAPETDLSLDEALQRVAVLQDRIAAGRGRLELHNSMLKEVRASVARLYSRAALERFDAGMSIRLGDHNDQRSRLEQELHGFESDFDRAIAELRRLQQLRRFAQITAPTPGQVVEWLVEDQQFVRAGDVVATFEADGPRVARGWMNDRMATSLNLGMEAEISLQIEGATRVLTGRVVEVEAGVNPAAPDQFGIIVTVAVSGISIEDSRTMMRFNAPVEVVVKKNLIASWLRAVN